MNNRKPKIIVDLLMVIFVVLSFVRWNGKRTKYLLYTLAGSIALGLGLLGIVLPLLPTTPLLLLACFCFSKGSIHLQHWLQNTWFYKKYLKKFAETKGMTVKTKLSILLTASVLMAFPFFFTPFWQIRLLVLFLLVFKWCYFLFRIKTIKTGNL